MKRRTKRMVKTSKREMYDVEDWATHAMRMKARSSNGRFDGKVTGATLKWDEKRKLWVGSLLVVRQEWR